MKWGRRQKSLGSQATAAGSRFGVGISGWTGRDNWSTEKAVKDGLQRVTWVFRCVDVIASNQASQVIEFRRGGSEGEVVPNHRSFPVLNSRANELEDSWTFRYRLSAQLLLSTKGVFVEKTRNRLGEVIELAILPPSFVTPIPDPIHWIKGFELAIPGEDKRTLPVDDVLWFRKPHPTDPYAALTPMQAAGMAIDTDFLARLYNRNFLLNDGRPGGLLVIKGDMEDSDETELRSRFTGNINRAGRVSVISGEGVDWVDTAITPRDAQWKDLARITQDEILLAFGVPKSQMGDASGRTYDNADAEDLIFWEKTMEPHCGMIARPLDALDLDTAIQAFFNFEQVPALVAARTRRRAHLLTEWEKGLISANEYREATGRPPVPGGTALYQPSLQKQWADTDEEYEAPAPPDPFAALRGPAAALPAGEPVTDDEDEMAPVKALLEALEELPADLRGPVLAQALGARTALLSDPVRPNWKDLLDGTMEVIADAQVVDLFAWSGPTEKSGFVVKSDEDRKRWEATVEKMLVRFFARQRKVVLDKLNGKKSREALRTKAKVTGQDVFDAHVWNDQLKDDMGPLLRGIHEEFGSIVATRAGVTFDPDAAEVVAARTCAW